LADASGAVISLAGRMQDALSSLQHANARSSGSPARGPVLA